MPMEQEEPESESSEDEDTSENWLQKVVWEVQKRQKQIQERRNKEAAKKVKRTPAPHLNQCSASIKDSGGKDLSSVRGGCSMGRRPSHPGCCMGHGPSHPECRLGHRPSHSEYRMGRRPSYPPGGGCCMGRRPSHLGR